MAVETRSPSQKAKESTDLALLEYRNTPISGMDLSPSQLLMSRRLHSNLPMTESPEVQRTFGEEAVKARIVL